MAGKYVNSWGPEHVKALDAWKKFCLSNGIDINVRVPGQAVRPSEGVAILRALERAKSAAADVRRAEADRDFLKRREQSIIEACDGVADGGQYRADIVSAIRRLREERDEARAALVKARDVAIPAGTVAVLPPVTATAGPAANPLRALREKAGLSQSEMGRRMGVSKRAVQLQEQRASVSAAMMARATKAIGGGE